MRFSLRVISLPILLLGLCASWVSAQTPYPMLMSLRPVAAQVGKSSLHTVYARYNLYGAYRVLVSGKGVRGEVVLPKKKAAAKPKAKVAAKKKRKNAKKGKTKKGKKKKAVAKKKPKPKKRPNLQQIKIRFIVSPGATPGVRDFRIATPQGVSTIGQLVIARDKVVVEKETNNTLAKAQPVSLPATLCGCIGKAEDVDFYKFKVKAGTSLTFHVRSMRLQDRIHDLQTHVDPIITLRRANGSTLAAKDNYFFADPLLSYRFKEAGETILEIRDLRFSGNRYWEYSIEVSESPFVTNVHPLAVRTNQSADLQLVGMSLPDKPLARFKAPKTISEQDWFPVSVQNRRTNPAPIIVTSSRVQIEPKAANNTFQQATKVKVPGVICGRIESVADIDCFSFTAKKNERLSFEVIARRRQSDLDSYLRILNAKGRQLKIADDSRLGRLSSADSQLEDWKVPADGRYTIEIRDMGLKGGATFVYMLKVTRSRPYFHLLVDTDKTQLTPSTGGVIFVRTIRKNGFKGPIDLKIAGLPKGVTAATGRILAGHNDGCIVLQAAAKAPMAVSNVRISGVGRHSAGKGKKSIELTAIGTPYQETYLPGGGRGHWPVSMHTVSVAAASDIRAVKLSTHNVVLKPGQSKRIEVTIQRRAGFKKNVTLDVIFKHLSSTYGSSLPKGVSLVGRSSKTLLTGKTSKGWITLRATKSAKPVKNQHVPVMASVSINFVMKATYSSGKPLLVTVTK